MFTCVQCGLDDSLKYLGAAIDRTVFEYVEEAGAGGGGMLFPFKGGGGGGRRRSVGVRRASSIRATRYHIAQVLETCSRNGRRTASPVPSPLPTEAQRVPSQRADLRLEELVKGGELTEAPFLVAKKSSFVHQKRVLP